jgi:prepilin-type N-terminal cleavage/methylation domain-containing protein
MNILKTSKKGYTIIELLVVITLIAVLATMMSQFYTYYITQWKNEKRMNAIRTYWIVLAEVVWRTWDIPAGYCSNDWWSTYTSSCFLADGCTATIACNSSTNYCKKVWTRFYDFNKLLTDYSYSTPVDLINSWENMPDWFNFKLCSRSAIAKAYSGSLIPKEPGYVWDTLDVTNPSFILQFSETDGTNRILYKRGDNF